jgi:hypothetical protein
MQQFYYGTNKVNIVLNTNLQQPVVVEVDENTEQINTITDNQNTEN